MPKSTTWYTQAVTAVFEQLSTSPKGLSEEEAQHRLETYGFNILPKAHSRTPLQRFMLQFHNILIYVLLISAVVTLYLQQYLDTAVIVAVVLINAAIGFIQEGKAEKALEAIRQILAPRANVMRDHKRSKISGERLVPGDIVLLEAGDKVPADLRIISSHGLMIQESILTGESHAAEKQVHANKANAPLGDRTCMAFSGTLVTSGQGTGVVVETGQHTQVGRISDLLSQVESLETPLIKHINIFARWLTLFIITVALLLLAYGYFINDYPFTRIFMVVVGLTVAAIPEGLPAVLTITLAIGAQTMARRNAIIRRLPAIETLGSVSVICTDKTGTLTRNEMMVKSLATHQGIFTFDGLSYAPKGAIMSGAKVIAASAFPALTEIARAATLCNDAELHGHEGTWDMSGDPTEAALLAMAGKINMSVLNEKSNWARTDTIPFDSQHRFMATMNHDHRGNAFIFIKGAPEQIISLCEFQKTTHADKEPLDSQYWHEIAENLAQEGQRVLALALKPIQPQQTVLEHSDIKESVILLGLVGMIDPPRKEAIRSIAECHEAGIQVKMITGDHPKTAMAIARQIGLQNPNKVLTGVEIEKLDEHALQQSILDCDIFARTSPEHKLRIVMALQSRGMTVAMTGDGVNDAPALKRADVGVGMGKHGTEVAKEACEIVLADDNFASIVAAIKEGRTVYNNIKKVISWTLPTSTGEASTIVVALLLGMTLPITPIQILWVNLITAITLGIALAFEPHDANTMKSPPRSRHEALLDYGLVWHIILVSVLFLCGVFGIYHYAINQGYTIELARTLVVNTLVIMEIFHLFFIRNINNTTLSWKNVLATKIVWFTVLIVILAQIAITFIPTLQRLFETQAITLFQIWLMLGIGATLFAVIELDKQIRLRVKERLKNRTSNPHAQ